MSMRKRKQLQLALVALTLALTVAPAAAQERIFEFVFPPPAIEYCYTEPGHWAWDGWQNVWVPSHTVCEYR